MFVNLTREDVTIQAVVNAGHIMKLGAASTEEFEVFRRSMKKNDYWGMCKIRAISVYNVLMDTQHSMARLPDTDNRTH